MTHASRTKRAIALSLLCLAFGCATTQSMSDAQRAAIRSVRSVSIAKNVAIPEHPIVTGLGEGGGGVVSAAGGGGGVGLILLPILIPIAILVQADREKKNAEAAVQLKKFLDEHKIDLKEIVRQEFIARIASARAFPAIVDEGGDARFDVTIESYGLAGATSMSPDKPLTPFVRLAAKLSMGDGKILWQNAVNIGVTSGEIEARKFEDILDDPPQRSREGFRKAAQFAVEKLLDEKSLDDLGATHVSAGSSTSVPQSVTGPSSPVTPEKLEGQAALADPTRASDTRPADALPMAGASWQYAYTMRGVGSARFTFGVRVTGIVGDVVHEIITIPSSPERIVSVSADSLSFRSFQLPQSQTLMELAPYLHSVLAKNETRMWGNLTGYPAGDAVLSPWIVTVRESGQEEYTVTVPAGTFTATRIEVSGRRARTPPAVFGHLAHESGRFRLRAWYAPQVRRYVRLQHETWPLSGAPSSVQLVELTSYSAK